MANSLEENGSRQPSPLDAEALLLSVKNLLLYAYII
jgi:hypothetical protein